MCTSNISTLFIETDPSSLLLHFCYTFSIKNKESVRRQIGMAVPVEGAKIILESILKTFEGIDYETVEPNVDIAELKESK